MKAPTDTAPRSMPDLTGMKLLPVPVSTGAWSATTMNAKTRRNVP